MKHTLFISFLICWCATAFSQSGVITGSVLDADSKTGLELATISILGQDSTLITYRLSDKDGKFAFDKLPLKKKLLVSITYTGYVAYHSTIQLNVGKADTLHVLLALNQDSNAVVVTSAVPIRMNGDTLEINPAGFKLKENAVVEELLNQVSGIVIWSDGTMTVNGKKVQNLLVDGKPFLGSTDGRVATQNLPKSAIDKIQLYQEYDRSNINQQQSRPVDSVLTMNIKLKESSKKGYFGKVGAGYGTFERFETDLSFQVYNKRSSAGIGAGFNNINKSIGNLQDMFQDNTYRNFNPNLYNVGRFGTSGINKNHSIGAAFTHNFIETANSRQNNRIAVTYNKSGTDAYITDLNLQSRTTINNPQFIRTEGVQNSRNNRHSIGVNYLKTNSYNDNLNVNGTVNTNNERSNAARFTEVRDSANQLQSTNRTTTQRKQQSDNEALNVSFSKSDRENPLRSFNFQFDASRGNTVSDRDEKTMFLSIIDPSKNLSLNRHYATTNNTLNLRGNLDYAGFKRLLFGRYSLFGSNLSFTQSINYNRQSEDNHVTDYDSTAKQYITNNNLTYGNTRELFEYTPAIRLSKDFFKWSDVFTRFINVQLRFLNDMKMDRNASTFDKRNLDRSFQFFRYEANINYQYSKQKKYQYYLSANYQKNYDYPSIDQLYTIVDDINVYDIRIGNPFLKNRINHSINFNSNFNTQNPQAVYTIGGNVSGGYVRSINPVTDSTFNDASGKRFSYYINADNSSSLNLNYSVNISRRLKKNSVQLMYNGRFATRNVPNYIDGIYNISETGDLSHLFKIQFSLRSILIVNLEKGLQNYTSKQTAARLTPFKNSNNTTRLGVNLNAPANFTFSSTVDNIDNSNLAKPTILWNAFTTYRFMKQQAELKLSAMDLLKQYQNITNSVNPYGTVTRVTNGLQQFFLVTFSYFPRKFGKTEIKKPATKTNDF